MKNKVFLGIIAVLLFVGFASAQSVRIPVPGPKDGTWWLFRARMTDSVSSASDSFGKEFEEYLVETRGADLEVFYLDKGVKTPFSGSSADDLKRMIGFYAHKDERKYLQFPLFVGMEPWKAEYEHKSPGAKKGREKVIRFLHHGYVKERFVEKNLAMDLPVEGIKITGTSPTHVNQVWTEYYSVEAEAIAFWHYDSNVGKSGAKTTIELLKFGSRENR